MKISQRAKSVEPSLTRKLFNLAKQYDDVIDLTLGDPDIMPDELIRQSAMMAIDKGKTRYSANAGLLNLRSEIAFSTEKEYGIKIDPEKEIIITVGGMEALYLSLSCLIDPGDEVIVLAPYYVNYVQMIRMCGGIPIVINTEESAGFQCSEEQLENAVTPKTVAIIINTPCNPTGTILSDESLRFISEFVERHDLTVISDEVYRTLIYDDNQHRSIINYCGMRDRTILVDSLSKRFSMTGYRIGYTVAPEEIIANMTKMQENVAACAPLPSQYAAIAAYRECRNDSYIRDLFCERRNYLYEAISGIDKLYCIKPQGAFYLFVNIKKTGLDCLSFSYSLLEKKHVAVVPGVSYGDHYSDHIRIAYTLEIPKLREAVHRIEQFVEML